MDSSLVELEESRRLTGPNLIADQAGAVIDGRVDASVAEAFVAAWRSRAREVMDAVGWSDEVIAERRYEGGLSVYLSGPIDVLYAATELNEWAWAAAAADVNAGPAGDPLATTLPGLVAAIAEESNPALLALQAAAREHEVDFLWDDDQVSVGTGKGSRTWDAGALPAPEDVPWDDVHDVPRVLVTGTNGKTTTVRMVAAIVEATGRTPGFTCTDGIHVGGEVVDAGDWSGPGGARAVLRDRRVEVAVLETARGGILRRGLGVDRAEGALVTNVAADHLGEWGILTVDDVATAKLVVAKAVRHGAPLVVNADDRNLSDVARALELPLTWIGVDEAEWARAQVSENASRKGGSDSCAWLLEDGWLTRCEVAVSVPVVEAVAIPATLGGAASYNVSNALGAAALAHALGLPDEAIRSGLLAFDSSPEQSPGRGNLYEIGGVRVLVDFVHNPHGFEALARMVRGLAPARVGLMIGHAGDRDDEAIRELTRAAWELEPGRVAVKEMEVYLRGRPLGEIPEVIRAEFEELGAPEQAVTVHEDEIAAARALLEWSQAGDFILLSSQADRPGVSALVEEARTSGWVPGRGLPA